MSPKLQLPEEGWLLKKKNNDFFLTANNILLDNTVRAGDNGMLCAHTPQWR